MALRTLTGLVILETGSPLEAIPFFWLTLLFPGSPRSRISLPYLLQRQSISPAQRLLKKPFGLGVSTLNYLQKLPLLLPFFFMLTVRHMGTPCIHYWIPAHGPPKRTDPCAQTSKIRDRIFQLIPLRPRR